MHEGTTYACELCDFKTRHPGNLQKHRKNHSKIKTEKGADKVKATAERMYKCETCEVTYYTLHGLIRHRQSKHEGIRYYCINCDYATTQQSTLNTHQRSMHDGIKHYCDQCDFKTGHPGNLKKHQVSRHKK